MPAAADPTQPVPRVAPVPSPAPAGATACRRRTTATRTPARCAGSIAAVIVIAIITLIAIALTRDDGDDDPPATTTTSSRTDDDVGADDDDPAGGDQHAGDHDAADRRRRRCRRRRHHRRRHHPPRCRRRRRHHPARSGPSLAAGTAASPTVPAEARACEGDQEGRCRRRPRSKPASTSCAGSIRYHRERYFELDEPEISDGEFDELYRELERLEQRVPRARVARLAHPGGGRGGVDDVQRPVPHLQPMLSLDNAFGLDDLLAWGKRIERPITDPVTLRGRAQDGRPRDLAALRARPLRAGGDARRRLVGEDVTANVAHHHDGPEAARGRRRARRVSRSAARCSCRCSRSRT